MAKTTARKPLVKGSRITGDQRSTLAAEFEQRYSGGDSIRVIADDTGRSFGFVHGLLKESGASLRGRGGATRGPRPGAAAPPGPQPVKKAPAKEATAKKAIAKKAPATKAAAKKAAAKKV